jgi:hypothetical protein
MSNVGRQLNATYVFDLKRLEADPMNRRDAVVALVALGAMAVSLRSWAQQQGKVWRVGYLSLSSVSAIDAARWRWCPARLQQLGHCATLRAMSAASAQCVWGSCPAWPNPALNRTGRYVAYCLSASARPAG